MQTSGDPNLSSQQQQPHRLPKSQSRLPKAYTEPQLAYLRANLPEFERKSQGAVRGDAKKFALERANEFIDQFGLPEEYHGVEEAESRFREQIYNWFKNTVGRTRRKLEGKTRPPKRADRVGHTTNNVSWANDVNGSGVIAYGTDASHSVSSSGQYTSVGHSLSNGQSPSLGGMNQLTLASLRDAFLTPGIESNTLGSMIHSFALAQASHTPLTTVVHALFAAISAAAAHPQPVSAPDPAHALLQRFLDACAFLPPTLLHAGAAGPAAGRRALQMQIRRAALWIPAPLAPPGSAASLADEMERINADRQRRKDYIQWARVHAAALELGAMGAGQDWEYARSRAFSEMVARDAVWEDDEVEWVAGICVLRAVIRTAVRGDARQREEYAELLRTYESRWKEIKDETRQGLVTEVLLGAKDDLARYDDGMLSH